MNEYKLQVTVKNYDRSWTGPMEHTLRAEDLAAAKQKLFAEMQAKYGNGNWKRYGW
jgi:hypothetical protein